MSCSSGVVPSASRASMACAWRQRRTSRRARGWLRCVGASPLIGAGTYADELCAVSGTGLGEAFIRTVLAHDVAARMRYRREKLASASAAALAAIAALGADGGLVAVDRRGNIAMPFNSEGMYRGAIHRRGRRAIAIY